jgi:hypothetical protein
MIENSTESDPAEFPLDFLLNAEAGGKGTET